MPAPRASGYRQGLRGPALHASWVLILIGAAVAAPRSSDAAPLSIAEALQAADRGLAEVLPDEPWALTCDVRWADSSTRAHGGLFKMIEPCEAGTQVAADFDPLPTYVRISGDRSTLAAELRAGAIRGCWKLGAEAKRRGRRATGRTADPTDVILGYRMGPAQMVRRAVEANQWARRLVRASLAAAPKFQEAGASDMGHLYHADIEGQPYLLAIDPQQRLRWLQVGKEAEGTRIELEPQGTALIPRRFRFQVGPRLATFTWEHRRHEGRWLPATLSVSAGEGEIPKVLLNHCVYDDGPDAAAAKARFDAARPIEPTPKAPPPTRGGRRTRSR